MNFIREYVRLCHEFCTTDSMTRVAMREQIVPRLEQELRSLEHAAAELRRVGVMDLYEQMQERVEEMQSAIDTARQRLGSQQLALF